MPALDARPERVEAEGLRTVTDRHSRAAATTRAGVRAPGGGLEPFAHEAEEAAPAATTPPTPP